MKRHVCHRAEYGWPHGPAGRIGQQDAAASIGDDTAMTTPPGPYLVRGAQVTCPVCHVPLTVSTSPPGTAGGTTLAVARCPECPFVMVAADPAPTIIVEDAAPPLDARVAFRAHERVRLEVRYADPATFVTRDASAR